MHDVLLTVGVQMVLEGVGGEAGGEESPSTLRTVQPVALCHIYNQGVWCTCISIRDTD